MKRIQDNLRTYDAYVPKSTKNIYRYDQKSKIGYWLTGIGAFLILVLFLPWTQNINANGHVTTQFQEQRPQQINTIIPGKIVKWYIKEGDFVKKGDTIIELADIKDDYLDSNLIDRTRDQLKSKEDKMLFYKEKINAIEGQLSSIEQNRDLKISAYENKIQQYKRKVLSDSLEMVSAEVEYKIAEDQLKRGKQLYNQGVISLIELEKRTGQNNKALAVLTEKQQKLLNTKQEITIAQIEINSIKQDANDKIYKSKGEIASSRGEIAVTNGDIAKNSNVLANYISRGRQKWLIAPQDGQIIKSKKSGINEIVKEGEMIVEMVPNNINYAVELFVDPMDLNLIEANQQVRLTFDGFPAIIFSGWPESSYGTFAGRVTMVENNRNDNGKFRIMVIPDSSLKVWPSSLRPGTGARGFALLKTVPVWYELWRQINGFPAEYYKSIEAKEPKKSK